jgi:membrane protein DedA with SNARE-associated domain
VWARAIPVLAETSAVLAGMGSMKFGRFILLTGLSNLGISLVYAWVGAFAATVQSFLFALAGAILLPLAAMMVFAGRWRRQRQVDLPSRSTDL